MKRFAFLGVAALLLIMGCGKKDPPVTNTAIAFQPLWGDSTIRLNANNTGPDGKRFRFSKIKMYWSHIRFVKDDNSEVEVKDIALVDWSNPASLTFSVNGISGSFKALKFGVGLDSAQSLIDPTTVSKESPLNPDNDMWWPNTHTYVFGEFEGQCDTGLVMPSGVFWNFLYHPGTNPCYRTVTLTHAFHFDANTQNTVALVADMKAIFYSTSHPIDIKTEPTTSTTDHPQLAYKFADQLAEAFHLK